MDERDCKTHWNLFSLRKDIFLKLDVAEIQVATHLVSTIRRGPLSHMREQLDFDRTYVLPK